MYLPDKISQAQRAEDLRKPLSRVNVLFPASEDYSYHQEQAHLDRPGSSLKTLFSRSLSFKSNTASDRYVHPPLYREPPSQPSVVHQGSPRSSSLTSSSRGTTSSTVDSTRCQVARASWDPPPLFQAFPQALRHALLDFPSASVESILRYSMRHQTIAAGSTASTNSEVAREANKSTRRHKRGPSANLMFSWTRKLYVLVANGYILQYSADGHHDRLPERILQLGHHSVAFASDAISGRPYVLQISRDSHPDDVAVEINGKTVWSRFGFRSAGEKRTARTFLLVCDSADEMDGWMIAVRKEIEANGGPQYRCGTPRADHDEATSGHELDQVAEPRQSADRAFQPSYILPPGSEAPINTSHTEFKPLPEIKTISTPWADQPLSQPRRSSKGSSVETATDLDDLRDSSRSCTTIASGYRLSLDGSTSSLSPANDKFINIAVAPAEILQASVGPRASESSPDLRTAEIAEHQVPLSSKHASVSTLPDQLRLSARDTDSRPLSGVPNFSSPSLSQCSRCSLVLSTRSSVAASDELRLSNVQQAAGEEVATVRFERRRPTSIIAPLPSREAINRKPRSRVASIEHVRPRSASESHTIASSPSLPKVLPSGMDNKPVPQPVYTLFPKSYPVPEVSKSSLPSSEADSPCTPTVTSHHRSSSTPLDAPTDFLKILGPRRIRRPASMQIDLRSSLDIEKPERSPAVTEMHFATNFGIADPFDRSSSIMVEKSATTVPPLELVINNVQEPCRPSRRRKAGSSSSLIGPPVGPPPSGPLPEPPLIHVRGSSVPAGFSSSRRVFLDLTTDDF